MANLTATEEANVKAIQVCFGKGKELMREMAQAARKLGKENREAGRHAEANAAMRAEAVAYAALGILTAGHADASDVLIAARDDGGEIVAYGAGGR